MKKPLRRLASGKVTSKPVRKRSLKVSKPKHDIAEQVRVLGADSLLPAEKKRGKTRAADPIPRFADFHDLLPDEPYWLIKGRDPLGEMFNMAWCMFRRYQIEMGLVPDNHEEQEQLRVGFANVSEMRIFAREYAVKKEHALMEFDQDGNAITRAGVKIPRGKKGS